MVHGPPDIKFSVEIPKSPFVAIENLTKLAHDPIPPYHSALFGCHLSPEMSMTVTCWNCQIFIDTRRIVLLGFPCSLRLPSDHWGPCESVDTHIVGVWNKNDQVTSVNPWCPQCPRGPKSAHNVKSWLLGARGVHRHPYCRGFKQKWKSDLCTPSVSSVS